MKCEFHPSAPATATCEKCAISLCGFCTNLIDDSCFCEKCSDEAQLENFVERRSQNGSDGVNSLLNEADAEDSQSVALEPAIAHKTNSKEKIHIGIVLVSCCIFIYQMINSFGAQRSLSPQEIITEENNRNQIESCMLVFWAIAEQLSADQEPDPSLRCEDSRLPMAVSTIDGDLRISHPRPDLLGLTDIYITRSNPIPILVE